MDGFLKSKKLILDLNEKSLLSLSCIEFFKDVESEYSQFIYSLCCYLHIGGLNPYIKLTSIESEDGYTLYASCIDKEEYKGRFFDLSENMNKKVIYESVNLLIENVDIFQEGEDVHSLRLSISDGQEVHFVSGEHYRNADGTYSVSVSDEMVLVFRKKEDAIRLGLP